MSTLRQRIDVVAAEFAAGKAAINELLRTQFPEAKTGDVAPDASLEFEAAVADHLSERLDAVGISVTSRELDSLAEDAANDMSWRQVLATKSENAAAADLSEQERHALTEAAEALVSHWVEANIGPVQSRESVRRPKPTLVR